MVTACYVIEEHVGTKTHKQLHVSKIHRVRLTNLIKLYEAYNRSSAETWKLGQMIDRTHVILTIRVVSNNDQSSPYRMDMY